MKTSIKRLLRNRISRRKWEEKLETSKCQSTADDQRNDDTRKNSIVCYEVPIFLCNLSQIKYKQNIRKYLVYFCVHHRKSCISNEAIEQKFICWAHVFFAKFRPDHANVEWGSLIRFQWKNICVNWTAYRKLCSFHHFAYKNLINSIDAIFLRWILHAWNNFS